MKIENFFLSEDLINSIDYDEIVATFDTMSELGIAHAPFENFAITIPETKVFLRKGPSGSIDPRPGALVEFEYQGLAGNLGAPIGPDGLPRIHEQGKVKITGFYQGRSMDYLWAAGQAFKEGAISEADSQNVVKGLARMASETSRILIVLLATKNIQKERVKNKLACLGIGKKRQGSNHSYITTISAPQGDELADDETHGTGLPRRPHLRRGHIRNQHYGPKGAFIKQIFIEPVFVNSDKDFVSLRDRYNVSL